MALHAYQHAQAAHAKSPAPWDCSRLRSPSLETALTSLSHRRPTSTHRVLLQLHEIELCIPCVQALYASGGQRDSSCTLSAARDPLRPPRCKFSTPPAFHVDSRVPLQPHVIKLCAPRDASSLRLRRTTSTHCVLIELHVIELCVPRGASSPLRPGVPHQQFVCLPSHT